MAEPVVAQPEGRRWGLLLRLRGVLSRELLALYLVVFLADVTVGLILPVFPLLARELGASLALIGALASVNGAAQVLGGVPIGALSDRVGRARVIAAGLALFTLVAALLAAARSPLWLLPAQALLGAGIVATFFVGAALVGDASGPAERGLAMGMLTTAMGLGFAVGPLLGGLVTTAYGPAAALWAASAVSAIGCMAAITLLPRPPARARLGAGAAVARPTLLRQSGPLLLACAAHFLFSPVFSTVIAALLPLRAGALGFTAAAIGGLYTLRALASTVTRIPIGLLCTPHGSRRLMLLAMLLAGAAVAGLGSLAGYGALAALLALEGVAYGMFLTAGQAYVSQHVPPRQLGAALGTYNAAGGISAALSPFLLGLLADRIGLSPVLWGMGSLLAAAALLLAAQRPRAAPPTPES